MSSKDDNEELAKLFFSFAHNEDLWSEVEGNTASESYYRGAQRILKSDWYERVIREAKIEALQAAAEGVAEVLYTTENDPVYKNKSHHDGIRNALSEIDNIVKDIKKKEKDE